LIQNRRSIYPNMYGTGEIDKDIINQMLENANWAPTHKLTEPWRFTVFFGGGREKLARFQAELYKEKTTISGKFDQSKYEKLLKKPLKASHIIAVGMKRDQKESVPEMEEIIATACALQNIYLTASAYGIGIYFSTGGVTYYEEAKYFFDLDKNDKLLGFFYLGNFEGKWPEGRRRYWRDKVKWIDN